MKTDLLDYGVCSIVRCSSCPQKISEECLGCVEVNAAAGAGSDARCVVYECVRERELESCFYCDDFPCLEFQSSKCLVMPDDRASKLLSNCGVSIISPDPDEVPQAAIARLAKYLVIAEVARRDGADILTSQDFAVTSRVKPELVRKDMSTFGHLGTPHVGYKIEECLEGLRSILNLRSIRNLVWMGLYQPYSPRRFIDRLNSFGCRVVAILDTDGSRPKKNSVGRVRVFGSDNLEKIVSNLAVIGAIIACRDEEAQESADRLLEAGIRKFLNLTSVILKLPEDAYSKNISIDQDLMVFSYYCGDS